MFRNIIGDQDGKTRDTGIYISDDDTSAAVIDITADSSDDESANAACIVIYCHYLPESGLGNLRACCLPWMW